jgi:hypothetical protein
VGYHVSVGSTTEGGKLMSNTETLVNLIIRYENGELSEGDTLGLFQELVDSGLAWSLQGSYGRTANYLIENELIYDRKDG